MKIKEMIKKVFGDNASVILRRLFYNVIPLVLFGVLIGEFIGIRAHMKYEQEKVEQLVSKYTITFVDKTDSTSTFTFKVQPWMFEK